MKAVIDNNLPVTIRERIQEIRPDADVVHIADLGLQDQKDSELRRRWQHEEIVWVTRDEDFWSDAPAKWAVVWVSCHNSTMTRCVPKGL